MDSSLWQYKVQADIRWTEGAGLDLPGGGLRWFDPGWKNRDPGWRTSPKMQQGSHFDLHS